MEGDDRSTMVARTLSTAQIAALSIPTREQIATAAAAIPQTSGKDTWRDHETVSRRFLEIGPGLVRLFRTSKHLADAARDRQHREKFITDQQAVKSEDYLCGMAKRAPSAGRIVGWSRRSRARMQMQLHRLDYSALFEAGLEPAMVTLTMPGEWEHLAPTPAAFKQIVNRFMSAYSVAWGHRIQGVWKMEFQRRGAPHLHILMTPPAGTASFGGLQMEFRAWLSHAWARSVGAEGEQAERHVRAGTGIDYVGDAYRDPRRIAAYFGKHGFFAGKDYQNEMPALWRDAIATGEMGARFWGSWGLPKASAVLQLADVASTEMQDVFESVGVSSDQANITQHYRRTDVRTFESEERQRYATDASVCRAAQRDVDHAGSASPDDVKVERYMRKLSKSLAMRGQQLERNKHGQLVLPRESTTIRRIRFEQLDPATGELVTRRRYRIGYYHGASGFLLVPDGRRTARDIQRILDTRAAWALAV